MHTKWLYRCLLAMFLVASLPAQQSSAPPAALQELPPTTDAKEIVRRAIESDQHNFRLARNYTCEQREVEKELDKNGNVKSQKSKIYDVGVYYDEVYSRLIQINDKPLSDLRAGQALSEQTQHVHLTWCKVSGRLRERNDRSLVGLCRYRGG